MPTRVAQIEPPAVRTVSLVSLGCPKNLVDSEKMLGLLAQDGLTPVSSEEGFEGSDAVVVNTCGFLEASKDESLDVIREALRAKERGEVKRVVVAGCLVQRHRAKLLEWAPGIDALVGVFDRDKIVEAVRGRGAERPTPLEDADRPRYWIAGNALQAARERGVARVGVTVNGKDGQGLGYFEDDGARLRLTPRHYAYLRVSEGCNQNCAFCTIPSIRGKMRSKPLDAVAREARELIADGAFELNLIGQDTTSYGDDIGVGWNPGGAPVGGGAYPGGLPALLDTIDRAAAESGAPAWIRLMYAYPSNFSDAFIDAFAEIAARGRLVPYIDIPLQHASDAMLAAMRRRVTADQQRTLIERLRARIPGLAVRTTLIAGFPGETEDDHSELLEFVEEMAFDALGVFEYSREDGTVAGRMEQDPALAVPPEVKRRRRDEIMELQQRLAFEQAEYLASQFDAARPLESGVHLDILIDAAGRGVGRATSGVGEGGRLYVGRAYFQAPQVDAVTLVQSATPRAPGELVRGVIVGSDGYDLVARPVAEFDRRVGLTVVR